MSKQRFSVAVGIALVAMTVIAFVGLPLFSTSALVSAQYREGACPSGESTEEAILAGGTELYSSLEHLATMADGVPVPAGDRYIICIDEFNEDWVGLDAAGLHRYVKRSGVVGTKFRCCP